MDGAAWARYGAADECGWPRRHSRQPAYVCAGGGGRFGGPARRCRGGSFPVRHRYRPAGASRSYVGRGCVGFIVGHGSRTIALFGSAPDLKQAFIHRDELADCPASRRDGGAGRWFFGAGGPPAFAGSAAVGYLRAAIAAQYSGADLTNPDWLCRPSGRYASRVLCGDVSGDRRTHVVLWQPFITQLLAKDSQGSLTGC